jgi:cell division protein FtsB
MRHRPTIDDEPSLTTIWRAISKFLAWLVAITLICISLAFFKPQIDRQAELDRLLQQQKDERAALQAENHRLESRVEWIKHDPAYLETQARDRLDMAREGETVVRFSDE